MTDRLYYNERDLCEFDGTVVRAEARADHAAVWLDRTAFYPTSGGQPFDAGTLGGAPVVDVSDDEAGDVVHLVAGSVPIVGTVLRGQIDWTRRFDHMQQHTAQHLLSAVLEHAHGARTLSFHLGRESSTIDLDRELGAGELADAERRANEVIWRNSPVVIRYANEDDARALPLRKESDRTGTLRLVEIGGVDLSACGGTHVATTGALGLLAIVSSERFKGGQRLEFLSGARSLRRFQQLRDTSQAAVRLLSVLPAELPDAIGRLQTDLKTQVRALATTQAALARHDALAMLSDAVPGVHGRLVARVLEGDAARLKAVASTIAGQPGYMAVLVSSSTPALALVARAADLSVRCDQVVAALVRAFNGKGGGKPDLAQCGGLQANPDAVLDAALNTLASVAE